MRIVIMSYSEAVKAKIVDKDTVRQHNDNVIVLQDQDLTSKGFELDNLPESFNAEVVTSEEALIRVETLNL